MVDTGLRAAESVILSARTCQNTLPDVGANLWRGHTQGRMQECYELGIVRLLLGREPTMPYEKVQEDWCQSVSART